ncbi:hypothetical protein [Lentzea sp. NBRC 105346]|uniref:hypothetical protein n=1 Tax=Lentzea sp. NBRC 105346 TaxID=3032205 RepID=UPI00255390A8|nr:hypothetical protein [Lentzea sp. NBRC 105346]
MSTPDPANRSHAVAVLTAAVDTMVTTLAHARGDLADDLVADVLLSYLLAVDSPVQHALALQETAHPNGPLAAALGHLRRAFAHFSADNRFEEARVNLARAKRSLDLLAS